MTRGAAAAAVWRCSLVWDSCDGRRGLDDEVLPGLAHSAPGLREFQPKVGENIFDRRPLEDGRDDLQFSGAAVWAMLKVELEHALEQACFFIN